ncbi:hypothetical protein DFQ27_009006 [Actinomortierella ambigua]|uniref:3CxxC-type domain-containing protein n=1 Tax=Actinomortierella ambigua TaxID=1343610 RepID=A0A9P6QJV6_9FUNG|nr:hypothetical protein DFQ27_009006 [Actinomortierella ambigua]
MYPELTENVEELLMKPFSFYEVDDSGSAAIKEYDTFVAGTFDCSNKRCSKKKWSSGKVAISIRMYGGDQYNARIHHQRCRRCDSLSRPALEADTYGERVSYRLNKWSGFKVVNPGQGSKTTPPHDCDNCEGCKIGRCRHDPDKPQFKNCRKNCRSDY